MYKNNIIIVLALLLMSCLSRETQLIGHWHEYKVDNPNNIINCYRYTDSSVSEGVFNNGYDYLRGSEIPKDSIYSWSTGFFELTSDYKIKDDVLFFNDSIRWKKVELTTKNFRDEFSIGLLVDIYPPQLKNINFELLELPNKPITYIFIGQIKTSLSKTFQKLGNEEFYMQFNDKIASLDEIKNYVNCYHCNMNEQIYIINADRNTPKQLIEAIENEMDNQSIRKNQIYYLYINENEMTYGFNQEFN